VFGGVAYQKRIRYDDWTDGVASFGLSLDNPNRYVGLGNDRFLPEAQFARSVDGPNAFGSVAVRVLPPVTAIANWTGQGLALGLSITPAMVDLTERAGDGARFSMSAGPRYNFR